jgi:recombination-promoting nuclease RpnB
MEKKNLVKPHDKLSRKFLTNLSVAKEFLTIYLLPEVLAKCDLSSLEIESGSYVEEDLRAHYADIVYRLDLHKSKSSAYVYVLIEHQSSAEKLMPFRILKYQLAIMQNHLEQHKQTDSLPLVVPIVFYNGVDSPYPYCTEISNLFTDVDVYAKIGLGSFKLVDLTTTDDKHLLEHGKLSVLEVLLKHIRDRDLTLEIAEVIVLALTIAKKMRISSSLVDASFSYLIDAREHEEIKKLTELIKKSELSEYVENIMTYAEQLRQEGWQNGKFAGLEEGALKGKLEGKLEERFEVAKNLKNLGVDIQVIAKSTGLTLEQIKQL